MNTVKLIWSTPNMDQTIAQIARVSNPANQANTKIDGLLRYMMEHGHVSPFEMANACVEINTTRDIGRQILRHRSFSFQEFSQRYASTDALPEAPLRECRLQDTENRQNSIANESSYLESWWAHAQTQVADLSESLYQAALRKGIAKEQARVLLPEGLTSSRMYMNGTLRSWIHYLKSRLDPSTQKEHRLIAQQILAGLREVAPVTMNAFFPVGGEAVHPQKDWVVNLDSALSFARDDYTCANPDCGHTGKMSDAKPGLLGGTVRCSECGFPIGDGV